MPPELINSKEKLISLKEAARISGYAPDYIGQLIRKGKISGKQVYLNVAWMTTEAAVSDYMKKNGLSGGRSHFGKDFSERVRRFRVKYFSMDMVVRMAERAMYVLVAVLFLFCLFLLWAFWANFARWMEGHGGLSFIPVAHAAAGVPKILSYQGRLFNSSGNLLGGAGTPYCFRFSIYDSISGGARLWPSATASVMTATVQSGVFSIGIGDVAAGGDALTYNFQDNDTVYLNVEVATKIDALCTGPSQVFEALAPRQRIVASGYAINSITVGGYTPAQGAAGNQIPVLASDTLTLAGTNPQINATGTNTLTLQGGAGTGAIQFFSASNFLSSSGALTVASSVSARMLQLAATVNQIVLRGPTGTGTISWSPSIAETLQIPDLGAASDTLVAANLSQTLNNKTLAAPNVVAGMSIVQNAASTGVTLSQNAPGIALAVTNAPTSTQATSTVSITAGANVTGQALLVSNFGSGNAIQVNDGSSTVFYVSGAGRTNFAPSTDTSTALTIMNASQTETLFAANTVSNTIKIGDSGAAGTIPTLLGLDVKSDAGDPTGFNGAMYYSSSTGSFRCYQAGAWANCVPTNMSWQPHFITGRWGFWAPTGIAATALTAVNMVAPTVNGTGAASAQAEDFYVQWTSAATNGSVGGETQAFTQTQPRYTPRLATRVRTDTAITSRRIWVALSSAAVTGSDVAAGAGTTVFFGLRYSTAAGDTTWQCGSGDGANVSYVNTGVTVATSTYYDIILDMSTPGQMICQIATNGGSYVSTLKSTNISTSTTNLGITNAATTLTGSALVHRIAYAYLGGRGN